MFDSSIVTAHAIMPLSTAPVGRRTTAQSLYMFASGVVAVHPTVLLSTAPTGRKRIAQGKQVASLLFRDLRRPGYANPSNPSFLSLLALKGRDSLLSTSHIRAKAPHFPSSPDTMALHCCWSNHI
jgi:hypothetical protein